MVTILGKSMDADNLTLVCMHRPTHRLTFN